MYIKKGNIHMKKRIFLMLFILVALVVMLSSCGHECNFVVEQEKAPDCLTSGYKVLGCTECDEERLENLPALGHDYEDTVVAPTCQAQGYTTQKCTRCGDTNNDAKLNFTTKLNHSFVHVENSKVEPTCTEAGYEMQKCSMCGFERSYNSVEKLGHKFETKIEQTVAPTCTEAGAGTEISRCTVCQAKNPDFTDRPNVEIPALGHDIQRTDDYRVSRVEVTCTTAQHDTWACKRSGCSYTEEADTLDPLGHEWTVDAGVKNAATCHTLETRTFNCVRFGNDGCVKTDAQGDVSKVKVTPNSYLAHTPGAAADCDSAQICTTCTATELCTECTMTDDKCTVCIDAGKKHVFANPTGEHDYDVATDKGLQRTVAPTCMQQGYSIYLCTGCNKTYNDNYTNIDPNNHNVDFDTMVGGKTVAATCNKYEYSVHACTNESINGIPCSYTEQKVVGDTYADHIFADAEPTGVITCTHCQKSFYDTTYNESTYEEYLGKEFDDNASLDVTITVSKEVGIPMKLTNAATSAVQVDADHADTTKIAIIRIVSSSEDVKFTVTVNGEVVTLDGSGYIDICAIGDITSLSVASEGTGDYEATVYFYGETAISVSND